MATSFINFINRAMLHEQTNGKDGRKFVSVSLPCAQSKSGYGTIAVSEKQVLPATKKDGTVRDEYANILLGDEGKTRKVSVLTDDGYKTVEILNKDLVDGFDAARNAYKAAATVKA